MRYIRRMPPDRTKWFFGYYQGSRDQTYEHMLRVAVTTAVRVANLEPCMLYDGEPSSLTAWVESMGGRVFPLRTTLLPMLERVLDAERVRIARGTFLRVHMPEVFEAAGITDRFVLYTDCDVMFLRDVASLRALKATCFAAAPEKTPWDYSYCNAGVMWLNTRYFRETYQEFLAFIDRRFDASWAYDQNAYNLFYARRWAQLSPDYNWKPYWGAHADAVLVHFHGPKPTDVDKARVGALSPVLRNLVCPSYFSFCERWWQVAREVCPDAVPAPAGAVSYACVNDPWLPQTDLIDVRERVRAIALTALLHRTHEFGLASADLAAAIAASDSARVDEIEAHRRTLRSALIDAQGWTQATGADMTSLELPLLKSLRQWTAQAKAGDEALKRMMAR